MYTQTECTLKMYTHVGVSVTEHKPIECQEFTEVAKFKVAKTFDIFKNEVCFIVQFTLW